MCWEILKCIIFIDLNLEFDKTFISFPVTINIFVCTEHKSMKSNSCPLALPFILFPPVFTYSEEILHGFSLTFSLYYKWYVATLISQHLSKHWVFPTEQTLQKHYHCQLYFCLFLLMCRCSLTYNTMELCSNKPIISWKYYKLKMHLTPTKHIA